MLTVSPYSSIRMSSGASINIPLRELSIPRKGKNWFTDVPYSPVIYNERFAYDLDPSKVNQKFLKYVSPVTKDIKDSSGTSKVTNGKDYFRIDLTVDSFNPEEMKVVVLDAFIAVCGHHEEREEGGGFISRTFERQYQLPRECDVENLKSTFRKGTLIIECPKEEVKLATIYDVREECVK